MGRLSGTETVVVLSNSKSTSLRSTIPVFVAKQMGLEDGDRLVWELGKSDGVWHANITKKGEA